MPPARPRAVGGLDLAGRDRGRAGQGYPGARRLEEGCGGSARAGGPALSPDRGELRREGAFGRVRTLSSRRARGAPERRRRTRGPRAQPGRSGRVGGGHGGDPTRDRGRARRSRAEGGARAPPARDRSRGRGAEGVRGAVGEDRARAGPLDGEGDRMSASALETPMMRQFLKIKAQYPDAILFYRMGDFYEMFLDDAERVAPILDITLTTRDKGKPDAVPMCGIPVHAADAHLKRLAELGHRIAICEQVEDPKEAGGRRLVRREVVEVVTPGLVGDPEGLDGRTVVAVAAIVEDGREGVYGLASLDASTGHFRATGIQTGDSEERARQVSGLPELLVQELSRIAPRELLVTADGLERWRAPLQALLPAMALTVVPSGSFAPHDSLGAWPGDWEEGAGSRAAFAVARYLAENQPFAVQSPPRLQRYEVDETVVLDPATRRHLEIHENSEDRGRAGTLLAELDVTACAMGARRLSHWLAYPLRSPAQIAERLDAVELLVEQDRVRGRLREAIGRVRDLDRLLSKATRPGSVPRDLGALRASLAALPDVVAALGSEAGDADSTTALLGGATPPIASFLRAPEPLPELTRLLEEALIDDPPVIARGSRGANETGYVREGYRSDLDSLRESATKGREWIAGLESAERERSGIASLKVRFHQ